MSGDMIGEGQVTRNSGSCAEHFVGVIDIQNGRAGDAALVSDKL